MAPFEVIYGCKCRTPLNWSETGKRTLIGPDIIQHAEDQVHAIREHLKDAQSCQKSNYDRKQKEMIYQPGEEVYLRVTPMRAHIVSESRASYLLAILVRSVSFLGVDQWHTDWSCRQTSPKSTCLS